MKICEVSSGLIPIPVDGAGAVEKIIFSLSRELGALGHEVIIVDAENKQPFQCPVNVTFERVTNLNIANRGFSHHLRGLFFMVASTAVVWKLVARRRIDVIHVHNQFSGFLIAIFNRVFWHLPLIFTTHNQEIFEDDFKKYLKSLPERYLLHKADHVVCVSPTVRDLLVSKVGVSRSHLRKIYSGVDIVARRPAERHISTSDACIITVARIVPRKNQMLVIEAAQEVIRRFPTAKFKFIGPVDDQSYFAALRARVTALGLEDCVGFSGEIDDASLESAYANADVFVLTSTNENQGLVILEAMARHVPVVCSSIGPFRDMASVMPGSVSLADDAAGVADAITKLLQTPEKRIEQCQRAEQVVSQLSWGNTAKAYEALFNVAVQRRQLSR